MSAEVPSSPAGTAETLQFFRDGRAYTRADIANATGLARSTVGIRIDELIEMGLLGAAAGSVYSGGRPSSSVAILPQARVILAADLGATHADVAITDLLGTVIASREAAIDVADGPEATLGWLASTARDLVTEVDREVADIAAVGLGLPAPIESATGRPTLPPIMPKWDAFDVPGWLTQRFPVPILVEKDVNIMALGERTQNWPQVENLLFVKMATGVGAGVIAGGRLHRGEQGIAGDIGHIQVARGAGVPCHCGNSGCLEAIASGPALAKFLRGLGHAALDANDVVALVRDGDLDAIQAVRQAGRDAGEVLAACVSMFNPSVMVVGGALSRAGEHLLAGVREVVYARSMPLATQRLSIVQSNSATRAGIAGASSLALDHVLSPAVVHGIRWR